MTGAQATQDQLALAGTSVKNPVAVLLSLLCGAISVLGFAPFDFWLLLLPGIAGLFVLVYYARSAKQGFLVGYCFGLSLFGAGVYWLYYSLHLFGAAIAPLAAIGTLLAVMILALYPALFGALAFRCRHLQASWFLLAAPALWLLIEWFRSWFLTGFPWLSIGYSTIDTPLAGFAPIGGVFLNSLLLALCCGALAYLFVSRKLVSLCVPVAVIAIIAGTGHGLRSISWTQVSGDPVNVEMVQGNIAQELKFVPNLLQDSLETYSRLSRTGADLVIWPESAIPTFFSDVGQWQNDFVAELSASGTSVLSGGFHANDDFSEYYNAIKVLGGTEDQIYTKRHLVPFGEYIPFRNVIKLLAQVITIPMSDLNPGNGPIKPITINGVHYGMSICYEDAFGNEMIAQMPTANILVNISNDAWFGDSTAPHQHQQIAAMRSLEFERPMLRVTNTGISSLISERGEILKQGPQFETTAINVDVTPRSGSTPFVSVGNWLVVILAALMLLIHVCAVRYHRARSGR